MGVPTLPREVSLSDSNSDSSWETKTQSRHRVLVTRPEKAPKKAPLEPAHLALEVSIVFCPDSLGAG